MLNRLIYKGAWEVRNQIEASQRQKIADLYNGWADELERKAKKYDMKTTPSSEFSAMNVRELKSLLQSQAAEIAKELEAGIKNDLLTISDAVVKSNKKWLEGLGFGGAGLEGAFVNVPKTVVENLVSGQVYQGGWNLSQRIWGDSEDTLAKLYEIVGGGRAQNLSTYDVAKQLEQYVRPGAKKQWNLRSADGKRIFPKNVDYNAQRLARTLSQHAYQQSFMATVQNNPMVQKVVWWANGSRACKICLAMHGQKLDKDKVPLDHPNGMCTLIPDVSETMVDDLKNWLNSPDGTNPELDEFAKNFGYNPKTILPKMPDIMEVPAVQKALAKELEPILTDDEKRVVKRYTEGMYKGFNEQADMFLSGAAKEKAFSKSGQELYDLVARQEGKFDKLYRIEVVPGFKVVDGKVIESPFDKDQQLTWGLRSTSKSEKFIAKAASGKDKNLPFVGNDWESKVVFRLKDETGLDVTKSSSYKYQQEVIVSGMFEVTNPGKVEKIGGVDVLVIDIKRKVKKRNV